MTLLPARRRALLVSLLAVLLLAAGVLVGACGDDSASDVDPEGVDATALLAEAAERMERVTAFHFDLDHDGGTAQFIPGVQMQSAEGDVVVPDRMQMTIRARASGVNLEISMVIVPEGSYMTNPLTGRWQRESITMDEVFDPASGVTSVMRAVQDAEVTRTERVGGVDTYVVDATVLAADLEFFASAPVEGAQPLPVRAWIGVDDPLVYRIEIEGPLNRGEADDLLRRLNLSNFDDDIEILPPR